MQYSTVSEEARTPRRDPDPAAVVDWVRGRLRWEDRLTELRRTAGVPLGREAEAREPERPPRAGARTAPVS